MVKGRRVLLGVTGSIAAYKAVEIARGLVKKGALVQTVMTASACRFVTPLTFAAVTGQPVFTNEIDFTENGEMSHISLAAQSDLVIVAPATANIIGKAAGGIADDLLSTLLLVARPPILMAPAMNCRMYEHPAVQKNIETLRTRGIEMEGPCSGDLACGEEGSGRMADPSDIIARAEAMLAQSGDLAGRIIMVTAGPTREPLDPVRFISNRSSGKMGYAIAEAAVRRGARVILVSGPVSLPQPSGLEAYDTVTTAAEMHDAVMGRLGGADALIMAAAVSDYSPDQPAAKKIKKQDDTLAVTLQKNPDILAEVGKRRKRPLLIGFAAETENLEKNAREKCRSKKLDLIVANDVSKPGIGFDSDDNEALLLSASGDATPLPRMSKSRMADAILDKIAILLQSTRS
ncbi:MAG: bifunctional phosphopantothenoylcysteine decarboxylase/phosphopantothenate--cysteine ligase CoaBC [Nitrospirota bacterium]|nr:bifunctional phosphopantothenoylcysteine decarboxylase/phosphopantothenate--cysteine ligase CoaBC [Nitrospirota bacterium]